MKERLKDTINNQQRIGHPALIERFVHQHGEAYTPDTCKEWDGVPGTPNECFSNAAHAVIESGGKYRYVEGYITRPDLPLLILHAWVSLPTGQWTDPTLSPERVAMLDYRGVEFTHTQMMDQLMKNGVYGLLDTGAGINHEMILDWCPEMAPWWEVLLQDSKPGDRDKIIPRIS